MTVDLEWFGCATFRARTDDLVVMLDAYLDRADGAAGPQPPVDPTSITDCDWVVVGHAHFDHLYGAERIMAASDATLIGSYESVRVMEAAGDDPDRMIAVGGGETIDLTTGDGRGTGVRLEVYPSQHSCVWSQVDADGAGGQMAPPDAVCLGDLGVTWQEQQRRMGLLMGYLGEELGSAAAEHLGASMVGHSTRGDGGALLFVLDTPDGRLLYQDTSGHWAGVFGGIAADAAILAAAGRANVDGEPVQGTLADFVADQAAMLGARHVVLGHHDDWLPGFSVPTDVEPIRTAMATRAPAATLLDLPYVASTTVLPVPDPPPADFEEPPS